ncbi:hypothetical protein MMPV_005525 [Pyropia vietnamensis]
MARAPLPPRPVAAVAVAASAALAAAATPIVFGGGWRVAAVASVLVAAFTAVTWPRFATDVLGLHGTSFPTPTSRGDWPLLGRLVEMAAAVKDYRVCLLFADWRVAAGVPNWQVWTGGTRRVFITNPVDVRYVLARANPPRDTSLLAAIGLVISPQVLLLTSGDIHTRTRRLVQTPLNADFLLASSVRVVLAEVGGRGGRFTNALATAAAATAGKAPGSVDSSAEGTLCMSRLFERMTLSVIHQAMVSEPLPSDEILDALNSALPMAMPVQLVPAPEFFAPRATARLRALGDYFIASFESHETARRAAYANGSRDPVPPQDILDVLLADVDDPQGAYRGDRRRLAADYMLLLSAGYDTTAHSLDWAILTLCRHPETQDRIVSEVAEVLGCPRDTPVVDLPLTPSSLDRLTYLQAVWKEITRLFPATAGGPSRRPATTLTLPSDGSIIPAGTAIKLPQYVVLHDEVAYPDAYAFRPERWLPSGPGGVAGVKTADASYFPFGLGPVACPGRRLSQLEWKAAIVGILWAYQLQVATGEPVRALDLFTLRPSRYEVRVTRREGSPRLPV